MTAAEPAKIKKAKPTPSPKAASPTPSPKPKPTKAPEKPAAESAPVESPKQTPRPLSYESVTINDSKYVALVCIGFGILFIFTLLVLIYVLVIKGSRNEEIKKIRRAWYNEFRKLSTLWSAEIAKKPDLPNILPRVKKYIILNDELAELQARLDENRVQTEILALQEEIGRKQKNLDTLEKDHLILNDKLVDVKSLLSELRADLPEKPNEFVIDAGKTGNKKAIALINEYNASVKPVNEAEAAIKAIKANIDEVNSQKKQIQEDLDDNEREGRDLMASFQSLLNEISVKKRESDSLMTIPTPPPMPS
jgi:hypothetical protein